MTASTSQNAEEGYGNEEEQTPSAPKHRRLRRYISRAAWITIVAALIVGAIAWLGFKASVINSELQAAEQLVEQLKVDIINDRKPEAEAKVTRLKEHTSTARQSTEDPLWKMAAVLPIVGNNFSAATDIARSADDVVRLSLDPLVRVFNSLDWDSLLPGAGDSNLEPIRRSAPTVAAAADSLRLSAGRLSAIDAGNLLPQVADPLIRVRNELESVQTALDTAANTARLAPDMLGSGSPRRYLLLVQNNAEVRATGGIPGAIAVLTANEGKLTLGSQTSAGEIGAFVPPVAVDQEQQGIYSSRLGKFMQDVNLTPDFPTTAASAKAMWEKKTGESLDGVISIDPVALSYILDATGPVQLADHDARALAAGMPTELSGKNVVKTLLSDVYEKIKEPKLQDAYFAAVSGEIFTALSSGKGEAKQLLEGIGRGVSERRVLVWSTHNNEQSVLSKYTLSGSISGASVSPAQFGVFFNDGTGAKMDYYMKRTAQLIKECPIDGYSQVKVRITSTNTLNPGAEAILPTYVTGGGAFGIPSGTVQTNVIAYGPTQANVETASQDGTTIPFSAQRHDERPVGIVTTRLAPGQSSTVEFNFGHIVQHSEPELLVTPTTDSVKNVVMPTVLEECNSDK